MIHELKIQRNYLERLVSGKKKAELRYNDRDYQLGDQLKFYNQLKGLNTPGDDDFYLWYTITHIHSGLGLADGYVMLSIEASLKQSGLAWLVQPSHG